ncbi:MAG TPA: hypothetical protein VFV67_09645 [Actinophytocola sp.]|uniref:hypothetical protein n=1 Tax=Actinophytocola sp. TaxID=1872138 RepID=UPI002DB7EA0F|nr:hypothetical protein [Actinophytocola sp.]HEU5470902.1 hypothetical protein [Actinophytocola sp.]
MRRHRGIARQRILSLLLLLREYGQDDGWPSLQGRRRKLSLIKCPACGRVGEARGNQMCHGGKHRRHPPRQTVAADPADRALLDPHDPPIYS